MARTTSETEATIEELLEQRAQYEEWLAKLDAAGDKAPPAVRQRVRGDYQARLQSVMEQLRGKGAAIGEELERHHASQAELDRERRAAEEALAEAEVRHSVGEYTEDEWRRVSQESRRQIEQLRSQLRSIGAEITRLTDIQAVITAPRGGSSASGTPAARPTRSEVVEQAPLATPVAEPVEDMVEEPASRYAPKSTPQSEPAAPPGDELAFLKSVAPEEARPVGRRISNPEMPAPGAPAVQTAAPSVGKAAAGVAKTLKCGECGSLNRPTEWYCERCGAELAGI